MKNTIGYISYALKKVKNWQLLIFDFLDRHHVWRSLDPTPDISKDFVKEKKPSASIFSSFASFFSIQKDASFAILLAIIACNYHLQLLLGTIPCNYCLELLFAIIARNYCLQFLLGIIAYKSNDKSS